MTKPNSITPNDSTLNVEFDKYYSRLRRIIIPLPNFKLFHKPYGVKDRDNQHIKREHIHSKLKQWLSSKSGNLSGSYLVTSFRGMGKTSIVGNVVDEMIHGSNHSPIKTTIINFGYTRQASGRQGVYLEKAL